MLGLTSLSFAAPWALAALGLLPIIWWLLKINPPAPRRLRFPAIRLLLGLKPREETPTKTPPWLLLMRLFLAALLVVAIAGPLLNPAPKLPGQGPLVLAIDNGWSAAPHWPSRLETAGALIDQAEQQQRGVVVIRSAPGDAPAGEAADGYVSGVMTAADARAMVQALQPRPWSDDRQALATAIAAADITAAAGRAGAVMWLSDGIVEGGTRDASAALLARLAALGNVQVYLDPDDKLARALSPPQTTVAGLAARVLRAAAPDTEAAELWIRASDAQGGLISRRQVAFADGGLAGEVVFELPSALRNKVARIDIEEEASAGAVLLLDERWRRRPVGLVSGGTFESSQPLLSELYYLDKALAPYHEVRRGDLAALLESELAVLILADVGRVVGDDRAALVRWMEAGGVLIRFAGPLLAESVDDLVPVRLRGGGRALGGALSWESPMPLGAFAADSPFNDLAIADEVRVRRQVLAEPSLDLDAKTWSRLADGTPLVTAEARADGWLVLFHTTANVDWADLALSGLFVDMLRRITGLAQGVGESGVPLALPAVTTLDGFGRLGDPPPDASPLAADTDAVGPLHPPGIYGDQIVRRTLNVGTGLSALAPLAPLLEGVRQAAYGLEAEVELGPWLIALAALLALVDTLIALSMRGYLPLPRRAATALIAIAVAGTLAGPWAAAPSRAAEDDERLIIETTRRTHLAYVLTGDAEVDQVSQEGLYGLGRVLWQRTAVEPGLPIGVALETDDLALFPLLYWPIADSQPALSDGALANVDQYLRGGGLILLDTRDQSPSLRLDPSGATGSPAMNSLMRGINVPPLTPIPDGHALTQAFYLLDRFPGRWDGSRVWVERYEGDINDGVSSLVIGGNDWAGAWALSTNGVPLFAVVPGGERQRELAFRFGINLVMYALTGNYKADQVHIPSILRRLSGEEQ